MARPSKRKSGYDRNPGLNFGQAKMMKQNLSEAGNSVLPILPNTHDHLVIQKLRTTPVGELAVDRLARDARQTAPALRDALRNVYFKASKARGLSKATKGQLKNAKSALSQLTHAVENLEKVSTDGRDGLRMQLSEAEDGDRGHLRTQS
jgi:hypothetical protein